MAIGTAGFTAMLCVMALERAGVRPESRRDPRHRAPPAAWAASRSRILAQRGYRVVASTGKLHEADT